MSAEGDWGKATSFLAASQPKTKVIVADKKEEAENLKAAIKASLREQQQQQSVQEQQKQVEEKKVPQPAPISKPKQEEVIQPPKQVQQT